MLGRAGRSTQTWGCVNLDHDFWKHWLYTQLQPPGTIFQMGCLFHNFCSMQKFQAHQLPSLTRMHLDVHHQSLHSGWWCQIRMSFFFFLKKKHLYFRLVRSRKINGSMASVSKLPLLQPPPIGLPLISLSLCFFLGPGCASLVFLPRVFASGNKPVSSLLRLRWPIPGTACCVLATGNGLPSQAADSLFSCAIGISGQNWLEPSNQFLANTGKEVQT